MSPQDKGDDYAATDVKVRCSGSNDDITGSNGIAKGDWTKWITCSEGQYFCGMRARIESKQDVSGDRTALNQLQVSCCEETGKNEFSCQYLPVVERFCSFAGVIFPLALSRTCASELVLFN